MRTPIARPDRDVPKPRKLSLEEACWKIGVAYTPERWGVAQYAEIFLRLIVAGVNNHELYGTSIWMDCITGYAPREGCTCPHGLGTVVADSPRPRRRRGPRA